MMTEPFDSKEAEFIRVISEGGTLNDAAEACGVHRTTLLRWLREDETGELRNQYARAREDQGDFAADEIAELRRKVATGIVDPQAARVMFDTLRWEAGKRKPKVYGDKLNLEASVSVKRASELGDDELANIAIRGSTGAFEKASDQG